MVNITHESEDFEVVLVSHKQIGLSLATDS